MKSLNIYNNIDIIFIFVRHGITETLKRQYRSHTEISESVRYVIPKISGILVWDFYGLIREFWDFFSNPKQSRVSSDVPILRFEIGNVGYWNRAHPKWVEQKAIQEEI